MSDTSEDISSESARIPYSERPEFSDIQPLNQEDGDVPVVKIAYSDKFNDVYGYFRAIYQSGEISTRALELTADALDLNPANYTVWHHRRHLLKELNADIHAELDFCRDIIEQHPKNYQVWLHRQVLIEWNQDPAKELRLTEIVLSQDAKNYHAWQHRQWVIKTFSLFQNELEYVERLLEEDIRNNSAWNQRMFVLSHTVQKLTGDILDRELEFAMNAITKVPGNESSWNYLTGILDKSEDVEKVRSREKIRNFCQTMMNDNNLKDKPIYLFATLVDINKSDDKYIDESLKLCDQLANEYDEIRKSYWNYIKSTLSAGKQQ